MMERSLFLTKFLKHPGLVGSITPSSRYLTREMLGDLPWEDFGSIVELGAGTGVFTEYINGNKRKDADYLIVEREPEMRKGLEARYPDFFYGSYAEKVGWYMQKQGMEQADCIVSGLPFANFPVDVREKIIRSVKDALKPGGYFVAFQYLLQMQKLLEDNFTQVEWSFVLRNLPCAFVYHCRK